MQCSQFQQPHCVNCVAQPHEMQYKRMKYNIVVEFVCGKKALIIFVWFSCEICFHFGEGTWRPRLLTDYQNLCKWKHTEHTLFCTYTHISIGDELDTRKWKKKHTHFIHFKLCNLFSFINLDLIDRICVLKLCQATAAALQAILSKRHNVFFINHLSKRQEKKHYRLRMNSSSICYTAIKMQSLMVLQLVPPLPLPLPLLLLQQWSSKR